MCSYSKQFQILNTDLKLKMKERNDKTVIVDSATDVPSRDHLNSNFRFVDFLHENFHTLPIPAVKYKPNFSCKDKHFNRQKSSQNSCN